MSESKKKEYSKLKKAKKQNVSSIFLEKKYGGNVASLCDIGDILKKAAIKIVDFVFVIFPDYFSLKIRRISHIRMVYNQFVFWD